MDWMAHNAGFVIASYVLSALGLALVAAIVLYRDSQASRDVQELKDGARGSMSDQLNGSARN